MKDRIIEFLRAENKSSAQFAEEIGVQPSGISHIISGRNNPSLDFILKMLEKYKYLSTDWLLFGKGSMYKDNTSMPGLFDQTLFDQKPVIEEKLETASEKSPENSLTNASTAISENERSDIPAGRTDNRVTGVEKIVWFYADGSFKEYRPRS
ncbi:MAG TPA: helix-turn-helix transcriptional regulator [Bacteroidales bacterium]|nr:helix-turn-helix transcriptional regulator [Bacteroidales bacterium]